MSKATDQPNWDNGTWEGNRRAQLRRSLKLTVRQRLEALEALNQTNNHMRHLRKTGRLHSPIT